MKKKMEAIRNSKNVLGYFINNTTRWGQYMQNGDGFTAEGVFSERLLDEHIDGKTTIGFHTTNPETNSCRWGALDFDDAKAEKNEEARKGQFKIAKIAWDILQNDYRISAWIEFSGKKGYHTVFKCKETDAGNVFRLLKEVRKKVDEKVGKVTGGETYPKQPHISKDGFGNWMKMPLGYHPITKKRMLLVNVITAESYTLEESIEEIKHAVINDVENIFTVDVEKMDNVSVKQKEIEKDNFRSNARKEVTKPCIKKLILNGESEGNRHQAYMVICHCCFRLGWTKDETRNLLYEFNRNCKPPKPESEVNRELEFQWGRSESGHTTYRIGCKGDGMVAQLLKRHCTFENRYDCLKYTYFTGKYSHVFVSKRLADDILKKIHVKTLIGSDEMLWYKDGVYRPDAKEQIKKMCGAMLRDKYRINCFNEVVSYIQSVSYIDPDDVNSGWTNLKNGLLNPLTMEFKKHTPDVFSIGQIPITYDSNADCPIFKEKLKSKVDEETFKVIQEMFGYCFLPNQRFQKAIMLYGPQRSMKSTTLYALTKVLGDDNVSAIPLQRLTNDNFAVAYLYGKTANICADLSSNALKDTGMFMMLVGEDKISSAKKREHEKSWFSSTKLIFSCNTIPTTNNKNPAFYRRWIILNFPNQTPVDEIDNALKSKIDGELAGILRWSLEGLKRLLENKKFSYSLSDEAIKDLYERNSDTIASFIVNKISTNSDESVVKKRDAYARYREFCVKNDLQPENVIRFGRDFLAQTGCGTCKKDKIPAYQGVGFIGVEKKNLKNFGEDGHDE